MRGALLLTVLLMTFGLAGCVDGDVPTDLYAGGANPSPLGDSAEGADADAQPGPAAPEEPQETEGPGAPVAQPIPNDAPQAVLDCFTRQGGVPLHIRFELKGSDADGDDLTFTFDNDDDGEIEESGFFADEVFMATYDEAGPHAATFTLSDGKTTTTATAVVSESDCPPLETTDYYDPYITTLAPPVTFSGEVVLFCAACFLILGGPVAPCLGLIAATAGGDATQGIDCVWFPLTPDMAQKPFVTNGPSDVDVEFRSSCSAIAGVTGIGGAGGHDFGTIPPGSGCVIMWDFLAGLGTMSITIG